MIQLYSLGYYENHHQNIPKCKKKKKINMEGSMQMTKWN